MMSAMARNCAPVNEPSSSAAPPPSLLLPQYQTYSPSQAAFISALIRFRCSSLIPMLSPRPFGASALAGRALRPVPPRRIVRLDKAIGPLGLPHSHRVALRASHRNPPLQKVFVGPQAGRL